MPFHEGGGNAIGAIDLDGIPRLVRIRPTNLPHLRHPRIRLEPLVYALQHSAIERRISRRIPPADQRREPGMMWVIPARLHRIRRDRRGRRLRDPPLAEPAHCSSMPADVLRQ